MCKAKVDILIRTQNAETREMHYAVHMRSIIAKLRRHHLLAYIGERHGPVGARLVRMLSQMGHLEQKQIVDYALAPPRDVRESLYNMLQSGILQTQEIPRSADRNPLKNIVTWHVNEARAYESAVRMMAATCGKMRRRLAADRERANVLLEAVKGRLDSLPDKERDELEYYVRAENVLENSLRNVMELVCLYMEW
jgi:DNA-directed RNA polymerase III subunit RPC3